MMELTPRLIKKPVARTARAPIPALPSWVTSLVDRSEQGDPHLTIHRGDGAALVSMRVPRADALDAAAFEQKSADAYRAIRKAVGSLHPVRFWNYLPKIHEAMDGVRDRYMVFNAGRFAALTEWFGGRDSLPARLPAASGVGHHDRNLEIHCLAFIEPGEAIENPRQIPAFRYSARYGPLPPCFARATVVTDPHDRSRLLLVAGTASIRGEQSVHQGDLRLQLDETIANLRALIQAAEGPDSPPADPLQSFMAICGYYERRQDVPVIEQYLRSAFGDATEVQLVQADICRADLRVEIEGIARLSESTSSRSRRA
jgi:chorismate lyase/3-hydroxybenzoate synthase